MGKNSSVVSWGANADMSEPDANADKNEEEQKDFSDDQVISA